MLIKAYEPCNWPIDRIKIFARIDCPEIADRSTKIQPYRNANSSKSILRNFSSVAFWISTRAPVVMSSINLLISQQRMKIPRVSIKCLSIIKKYFALIYFTLNFFTASLRNFWEIHQNFRPDGERARILEMNPQIHLEHQA